ncbi:hypothetical protein SRHO_G00249980 [Serrasalmus rhombeus]
MKIKSQRKSSSVWLLSMQSVLHGSWASADFDLAQIRLIVYQDCERRGRQVLFDSKAIRKLDPSEPSAEETKATPTRSGACQISSKASQKEAPPTYQASL